MTFDLSRVTTAVGRKSVARWQIVCADCLTYCSLHCTVQSTYAEPYYVSDVRPICGTAGAVSMPDLPLS